MGTRRQRKEPIIRGFGTQPVPGSAASCPDGVDGVDGVDGADGRYPGMCPPGRRAPGARDVPRPRGCQADTPSLPSLPFPSFPFPAAEAAET